MVFNAIAEIDADPRFVRLFPDLSPAEQFEKVRQTDPRDIDGTIIVIRQVMDLLERIVGGEMTRIDKVVRADEIFGEGSGPDKQKRYGHVVMTCMKVLSVLRTDDSSLNVSEALRGILIEDINKIAMKFNASYRMAVAGDVWAAEDTGSALSRLRQSKLSGLVTGSAAANKNHAQKVIDEFLDIAADKMLRKDAKIDEKDNNPMLYEPMYITMEQDGKQYNVYTMCYVEYKPTISFIYSEFEDNESLRIETTKKDGLVNRVAREFKRTHSKKLPAIERNRMLWAFNNCVYDIDKRIAYYYVPKAGQHSVSELDHNLVAMHYIDQYFDYDKYMREARSQGGFDPMLVKTPNADRVMKDQDWEYDMWKWFYVLFFGRQLFPLKYKDTWEIYVLIQGLGGTGKSTFIKVFMEFFPVEKVGILNSNGRNSFPLQHLYDKDFIACMECGDLDMQQNRFNSLVSAERVSVEQMFQKDIAMDWSTPICLAGNSPPPFPNEGDSAGRRTACFRHTKHVKNSDPNLGKRLLNEIPAIMFKSTMQYHIACKTFGHRDIWSGFGNKLKCPHGDACPYTAKNIECLDAKPVLPLSFHRNRQYIQALSNPIFGFLCSDRVELGDDQAVEFQDFKRAFESYCEDQGVKSVGYKFDDFSECFERYLIHTTDPRGSDDPKYKFRRIYLEGVGVVVNGAPAAQRARR